jgi:hypothetical protein
LPLLSRSLYDVIISNVIWSIINILMISSLDIYQIGWYNILNVVNVCIFPQIINVKDDGYQYGI